MLVLTVGSRIDGNTAAVVNTNLSCQTNLPAARIDFRTALTPDQSSFVSPDQSRGGG